MSKEKNAPLGLETATLASGCFWCTEAVFYIIKGVTSVEPGYTGGNAPNPSYDQVSSGKTGHTEAVQITYDPSVISYKEILEIFFATHDPTTLNRQGHDVGTQYRSAIFIHNETQKRIALETVEDLDRQGIWDSPIVTQLLPLRIFYKAEEYHKGYFKRHKDAAYCQQVITPKIAKLQQRFLSKIKAPSL